VRFQKLSYLEYATQLVYNKYYKNTNDAGYNDDSFDYVVRCFIGSVVLQTRSYEVFEQRRTKGVEVT